MTEIVVKIGTWFLDAYILAKKQEVSFLKLTSYFCLFLFQMLGMI